MTHELNIEQDRLDRVVEGQQKALVVEHDRDYQVGDSVLLYGGTKYPTWFKRARHYVERDAKGRFVNSWEDDEPVVVAVTHVGLAALVDGVTAGHSLLSFEVVES